jgi:hypothetical protein
VRNAGPSGRPSFPAARRRSGRRACKRLRPAPLAPAAQCQR